MKCIVACGACCAGVAKYSSDANESSPEMLSSNVPELTDV
jgi:hypothetical protein